MAAEQRAFRNVLGDELKRRRQASGIALDTLARRLGVESAALENLESGSGMVDLFLAEQMAGLLGCTLSFTLVDRLQKERAEPADSLVQAIWPV